MICLQTQPDTRSRIILGLRAPPELGVGLWAALSYLTGSSAATAAEMGRETGQQRDPSETCVPVPGPRTCTQGIRQQVSTAKPA